MAGNAGQFQKGVSGNPAGRGTEKLFRDAMMLAVTEKDKTKKRRKLRLIAEKVVDQAVKGEPWAVKEVADRIDGKPAQQLNLAGHDGGAFNVTVSKDEDAL